MPIRPEVLSQITGVTPVTLRSWRGEWGFNVLPDYESRRGFTFAQALALFIMWKLTDRGFTARKAADLVIAARANIEAAAHGGGGILFVGRSDSGGLDVIEVPQTAFAIDGLGALDDHIALAIDTRALAAELWLKITDVVRGEAAV